MQRERPLQRLTRRTLYLVDAALATLYTIAFGVVLYSVLENTPPDYRISTSATLTAIEALLFAIGWRNTTIHVGRELCILYRNGFIPLYTAMFTLAAWFYYWAPASPSALEAILIAFALPYIVFRSLGDRAVRLSLLFSPLVGLAAYILHPDWPTAAIAFSAPQLAVAIAKPRLLCDDRPVLMIVGLYTLIGALVGLFILTLRAP